MKYYNSIKYIPNILSSSRVILSLILLVLQPLSASFFLVYILCGSTDVLDGYIARKTNSMSKFGAKIDSIADIIFIGVILLVLFPIVSLTKWIIIWILGVAFIRMISIVVGYVKYATFASLHTYGNKVTGLFVFSFPFIYQLLGINITAIIILAVASLSAFEELMINIKSQNLNVNIKSLFYKNDLPNVQSKGVIK